MWTVTWFRQEYFSVRFGLGFCVLQWLRKYSKAGSVEGGTNWFTPMKLIIHLHNNYFEHSVNLFGFEQVLFFSSFGMKSKLACMSYEKNRIFIKELFLLHWMSVYTIRNILISLPTCKHMILWLCFTFVILLVLSSLFIVLNLFIVLTGARWPDWFLCWKF